MTNYEALLDRRELVRFRQEERAVVKMDRDERKAAPLVGELCRDGRTLFYVNGRGGRVHTFPARWQAVDFLIRNQYV